MPFIQNLFETTNKKASNEKRKKKTMLIPKIWQILKHLSMSFDQT